jgi:mRNA interferase RelE/StbE
MPGDIDYKVVPSRRFEKELQKHARENQKRVLKALQDIRKDPYDHKKAAKLRGDRVGQYRWRVGQLRVFYEVEGDKIHLLHVKKRDHAYDK